MLLIAVLLLNLSANADSLPCHKALQEMFGPGLKKEGNGRPGKVQSSQADIRKMDLYRAETSKLLGERSGLNKVEDKARLDEIDREWKRLYKEYLGHLPNPDHAGLSRYVEKIPNGVAKDDVFLQVQNDRPSEIGFYFSPKNSTLYFDYGFSVGTLSGGGTFAINTNTCEATPEWKNFCHLAKVLPQMPSAVNSSELESMYQGSLERYAAECKASEGYVEAQIKGSGSKRIPYTAMATPKNATFISCECERNTFYHGAMVAYHTCSGQLTKDGQTLLEVAKRIHPDRKIAEEMVTQNTWCHIEKFCSVFAANSTGGGGGRSEPSSAIAK